MLEAAQHGDNAFVTLTYDDENLPEGGTVVPKHLQDWLKRVRKAVYPKKIRFYAVGEYGDESQRPHYHAALFGYPCCLRGNSQFSQSGQLKCCEVCKLLKSTWQFGRVFVGSLETHSAQYVAGYVTKKLTAKDDPRLNGRHPEFCRMSLRPGIGASAMHDVASVLMQFNLEKTQADVPVSLRHGSRQLPLGRYLRGKLRTMVGADEKAPQAVLEKQAQEMRPLLEAAKRSAENPSLKGQILAANKGRVASMEARQRIFKGKRSL